LICPDAEPDAVIPLAQVAEKVPASEFEVWLVTCQEKPVQLLAEIPVNGDVQVPSIEGATGAELELDDDDSVLGARIEELCSNPAHAPVAAAAMTRPTRTSRCMAITLVHVRFADAHRVTVITKAVVQVSKV
jgi:hypothetical protein